MLYLSRKVGQSIHIGHDIRIQVVKINKHSVQLGFAFKKETRILREEIYHRILEENRLAAQKALEIQNILESAFS